MLPSVEMTSVKRWMLQTCRRLGQVSSNIYSKGI